MDEIEGLFDIKRKNNRVCMKFEDCTIRKEKISKLIIALERLSNYPNQNSIKMNRERTVKRLSSKNYSPECIFCGGDDKRDNYLVSINNNKDCYKVEFYLHNECIENFVNFLRFLDENPENYIQYYI